MYIVLQPEVRADLDMLQSCAAAENVFRSVSLLVTAG